MVKARLIAKALKNPLCRLLLAVPIVATAAIAATPSDYIASRQAGYKQIAKANKAILDELRGGSPSMATIAANAQILTRYADKIHSWFPRGSGPESAVKTAALPAIWTNPNGFRQSSQSFSLSSKRLLVAASRKDLPAVTAASAQVGESCRSCHQSYRGRS
jgi:cytochrome c556